MHQSNTDNTDNSNYFEHWIKNDESIIGSSVAFELSILSHIPKNSESHIYESVLPKYKQTKSNANETFICDSSQTDFPSLYSSQFYSVQPMLIGKTFCKMDGCFPPSENKEDSYTKTYYQELKIPSHFTSTEFSSFRKSILENEEAKCFHLQNSKSHETEAALSKKTQTRSKNNNLQTESLDTENDFAIKKERIISDLFCSFENFAPKSGGYHSVASPQLKESFRKDSESSVQLHKSDQVMLESSDNLTNWQLLDGRNIEEELNRVPDGSRESALHVVRERSMQSRWMLADKVEDEMMLKQREHLLEQFQEKTNQPKENLYKEYSQTRENEQKSQQSIEEASSINPETEKRIDELITKRRKKHIQKQIDEAKQFKKDFGYWVRKEGPMNPDESSMWDDAEESMQLKEQEQAEKSGDDKSGMTLEEMKNRLKNASSLNLSEGEQLHLQKAINKQELKIELQVRLSKMTQLEKGRWQLQKELYEQSAYRNHLPRKIKREMEIELADKILTQSGVLNSFRSDDQSNLSLNDTDKTINKEDFLGASLSQTTQSFGSSFMEERSANQSYSSFIPASFSTKSQRPPIHYQQNSQNFLKYDSNSSSNNFKSPHYTLPKRSRFTFYEAHPTCSDEVLPSSAISKTAKVNKNTLKGKFANHFESIFLPTLQLLWNYPFPENSYFSSSDALNFNGDVFTGESLFLTPLIKTISPSDQETFPVYDQMTFFQQQHHDFVEPFELPVSVILKRRHCAIPLILPSSLNLSYFSQPTYRRAMRAFRSERRSGCISTKALYAMLQFRPPRPEQVNLFSLGHKRYNYK